MKNLKQNNTNHNAFELGSLNVQQPASILVVIDTQVADWQLLRDAAPAGSEIILIRNGENGIDVIVEALSGRSGVDAIHIFSHGSSGQLQLGSASLNSKTLSANPEIAAAIKQGMTESGDLFLYGCEVAQGDAGQQFVTMLANMTSADVAASTDHTGSTQLRGDWDLEFSTGLLDQQQISATDYAAILVTGTVTFTAGSTYIGGVASQDLGGVTFEVRNITNTDGTTDTGEISFYDNNFYFSNDPGYTGITSSEPTGEVWQGMSIKSADGSEFQINGFTYYNWGTQQPFNLIVKGFVNGVEVATTTLQGFDAEYDPLIMSLEAAFDYVDEVRLYRDPASMVDVYHNHSLNYIQIDDAVPPSQAPTLTANGINPGFTENGNAVQLFGAATAATNDGGQSFSGMTLTVTNVTNGAAEYLSIGGTTVALNNGNSGSLAGIGSYSVSVAAGTATVTVTGLTQGDAQMSTLIGGITYGNTSDSPGNTSRVVTVTQITDSGSSNNTAAPGISSTVSVAAVNDTPQATNLTQFKSFTEDPAGAIALDDIVVSDPDAGDSITATLTVSDPGAGSLSTGTYGSATSTYNAGTGVWTVTGSVADVNAALAAVAFSPAANWDSDFSIRTNIRDAAVTGPADGNIFFEVTAVNDAPALNITPSGISTFVENGSAVTVFTEDDVVDVVDVDHASLAQATVAITGNFEAGADVLAFTNDDAVSFGNITGSYNAGTGVLTLVSAGATATLAQFENALKAVTFSNSSEDPSAALRTLSYTLNDGSLDSVASTRTLSVAAINDPPTAGVDNGYVNTGAALTSGQLVTINDAMLHEGDPDNSGAELVYEITSATASGALFLDANDNNTADGGEERGLGGTFTQADIDAGRVKYQHGGGPGAADSFGFSVTDGEGSLTDQTFNFVISVRPVVTTGPDTSYSEDATPVALAPALTLTDEDSVSMNGAVITITDLVVGDTLGFTDQNGITGSFDQGTGVLTLTGAATIANYQAALRSVTFSSSSQNPATGAGNDDRVIEFRVTDSGGLQSVAGTQITLSVANVNDAPVLDSAESPTLAGITEDLAAPADGDTGNSTSVAALLGGATDVDSGALQGIAITDVDSAHGTLWYSVTGGEGAVWAQVTDAADDNALLLGTSALLYWQPAENDNGTVTEALTFRSWDRTDAGVAGTYVDATTNGGITAFSAATDTVSVDVAAVNDSPDLAVGTTALAGVDENTTTTAASINGLLIALGYSDADSDAGGVAITGAEGNGDWQYSTDGSNWFDVAAVDDHAALLLDAAAFVRYAPDGANGEAGAQLVLRAWDRTAGTATDGDTRSTADTAVHGGATAYSGELATVAVAVSDVNDAPVLTAAGGALASIDEDNLDSDGYRVSDILAASVSDADTGALQGIAIYAATIATPGYTGKWQYSVDDGTSWTDVGVVNDSAALLLRAADYVRFVPDGKNAVTAGFDFRAWDQTTGTAGQKVNANITGGASAFSSAADSRSIDVTAVNDAPVLDISGNPTLTSLLPDAAAPEGGVTLGSAQGATLVSSLTAGASDVDGNVPGIAITHKAATGTLWYSTNAGASWTASNAVSDAGALLLRATDLLYYEPADGVAGMTDVLSFRAWDTTVGAEGGYMDVTTNGGITAFSTATEDVQVSIGFVNTAPLVSATPKAVAFTENGAAMMLFSNASVSVGPAGDSGQRLTGITLTVAGVSDGDAELLVIDGSEVSLSHGNNTITAGHGLSLIVAVTGDTATVTVSGASMTNLQMQTLINALAYRNSSDAPGTQNRVVTLTSVTDNGGTENGGADTRVLNIAATVTVTAVNDVPAGNVAIAGTVMTGSVLRVVESLSDADGIGQFSYVWQADGDVIDGATDSSLLLDDSLLGKSITVTVSYTDQGGTQESIVSPATAAVVAKPNTIDGAVVGEPRQETAPDGTQVQVTEIDIVPDERDEQTGETELANVPLITDAGNNTLLEVGLPAGVGMRIETPGEQTGGINGLIAAIRARTNTADAQQDQQEMTQAGTLFLQELPDNGADLLVRTLVPVVATGSNGAPAHAIKVSALPAQTGGQPVATVIDVRGLPSGTIIELDNIQFVAIVGEVTLTGGAGPQVVSGDSKRQIIVLGEGDDIIRGGGGDDFIGSRSGNDQLYGDAGDDHIAGGAGNDYLDGGAGNDILQGGASDGGMWRFALRDDELITDFSASHPLGADMTSLTITGPWWTQADNTGRETDHRLQFTYESVDRLQLIATLYAAAVGEKAELMEFNHFATSALSAEQLAQAAVDHFFGRQPVPQAVEVQVKMLIEAVWGEGAATDELIQVGTDFIVGGGSWADGILMLARAPESEQLLIDDDGDLVLVKDLHSSETGLRQAGSGDDTLIGGAGNDRLIGGGGNNFLDGGTGTDVAVYVGAPEEFTFRIREVNGQTQMVLRRDHAGETDVLQNIELLKIGGYYYAPAGNFDDVALNTDYALADYLVPLIAEQVNAMDLAGFY